MLPSVLTLLDFAASGVAAADTGAQGVMPFPFGLLGGASDTGVTPTPPPPPVIGGDDFPGGAYRKGERKRRGLERERVTSDAERLAEMQRAYARAMGEDTPAPVVAAVAAAVRPHIAASSDAILPPIEAIDWPGLLRDLGAIAVILQQHQEAVDDEAALTLLLLS